MGGIVSILICMWAAYLAYGAGQKLLLIAAIVVGFLSFWSFGVMHNYASYARRERIRRIRENLKNEGNADSEQQARLEHLERGLEPQAVPNWLAVVNFSFTLIGVLILVLTFLLK